MAQVPNSQPVGQQANSGQSSKVPSLQEIQAKLQELGKVLDAEYRVSPALTFVKQKLREAATSIDQELRNVTIEAQEEARRAEAAAKRAL